MFAQAYHYNSMQAFAILCYEIDVKFLGVKASGKKRVERVRCFSAKIINKVCSENVDLALVKQVGIVKELEYKIGQGSLLIYPYFVTFQGFETYFDIL